MRSMILSTEDSQGANQGRQKMNEKIIEKVTLEVRGKEVELTVVEFQPRVFTAEEWARLTNKAGK